MVETHNSDSSIREPLIALCLEKFEHVQQLDLANHSNGKDSLQIDVIIGADYYWELIPGCTN